MGFFTDLSHLKDNIYDTAMKYGDPSVLTPEQLERASRLRNNHRYCIDCQKVFSVNIDDEIESGVQQLRCISCENKYREQLRREEQSKSQEGEYHSQDNEYEDEFEKIKSDFIAARRRREPDPYEENEKIKSELIAARKKRELDPSKEPPDDLIEFYGRLESNKVIQKVMDDLKKMSKEHPLEYIYISPYEIYIKEFSSSYYVSPETLAVFADYHYSKLSYEQVQVVALYLCFNIECYVCSDILYPQNYMTSYDEPYASEAEIEAYNYTVAIKIEPPKYNEW